MWLFSLRCHLYLENDCSVYRDWNLSFPGRKNTGIQYKGMECTVSLKTAFQSGQQCMSGSGEDHAETEAHVICLPVI